MMAGGQALVNIPYKHKKLNKLYKQNINANILYNIRDKEH